MKSTSILVTIASMLSLTMASPARADVDSSVQNIRRATGNETISIPTSGNITTVTRAALSKKLGCLPRQTLTFVKSVPKCTDCDPFVQTCEQASAKTRNTVSLGCVQNAHMNTNKYSIECSACPGDTGSLANNRDLKCTPCLPGAVTCILGAKARDLTCHSNRYLLKNATTGFSRCTDCGNGTTTALRNSAPKCKACPLGATSCNSNLSPVNSTACALPYYLNVKINAVGIGYGKCIPLVMVAPNATVV